MLRIICQNKTAESIEFVFLRTDTVGSLINPLVYVGLSLTFANVLPNIGIMSLLLLAGFVQPIIMTGVHITPKLLRDEKINKTQIAWSLFANFSDNNHYKLYRK